ncbi:MAG: hypothetical protein R3284_09000 [Rubricoccaceae bacterium]|nr:hypothetical protein [Rubricoccaceae bacterium]
MKAVQNYLVPFLLGVLTALALAAQAKATSGFQISLMAKGTIEMECSEGCVWEKLSWTCGENQPNNECTTAFNENGMGRSD